MFDEFQRALGFGARTRRAFDRRVDAFVGVPVAEFDARALTRHVDVVPTLVVHDRNDRRLAWAESVALVDRWPDALLVTTEGLGHSRLLGDPAVHAEIVRFVSP